MIDVAVLANAVHRTWADAVEHGWSVEIRITPEDKTPTIVIAVIQQESMRNWVGLKDEDG